MFRDVLSGIHADVLDCLQANLAVLADHHHGAGTHLRLGDTLGFSPVFGDRLPTVAATPADRLAEAERVLGLVATERKYNVSPADLIAVLDDGQPRYVVADAYLMPWVPYCGQQHLEHSFLVCKESKGLLITDAYHNATRWGDARPGTWTLTEAEFAEAIATGAGIVARMRPVPLPDLSVPVVTPADPDVVWRYVAAYRDHEDRHAAFCGLTLETWLLARERQLYARRTGDPRVAARLPEWKRLTEQVYLAQRRIEFGRGEPPHVLASLTELLMAEADVSTQDSMVRDVIVGTLGQVLGTGPDPAATTFAEIPGFDSFRLVDLIEQAERALGTEIPADELVPENLADVESLTALFVRCLARGPVDA